MGRRNSPSRRPSPHAPALAAAGRRHRAARERFPMPPCSALQRRGRRRLLGGGQPEGAPGVGGVLNMENAMRAFRDLTGRRFGQLTVKERATNSKNGQVCWLCECECGNQKIVAGGSLIMETRSLAGACAGATPSTPHPRCNQWPASQSTTPASKVLRGSGPPRFPSIASALRNTNDWLRNSHNRQSRSGRQSQSRPQSRRRH